jgi:hypothetical protein
MLLRGLGLGMAGMAFGGAFAAGMAFGVAGVGAACLARGMMRRRTRWRDADHAAPAGPMPGDDEPHAAEGQPS